MLSKTKIERLYDKSRRGFLRGIFSRATIIFLIIILQLVVVAMSYLWLYQYRIHLQVTEVVLCILAIIYLFQSDMEPTAINTWLLIVLPFPIIGALLLAYTKLDIGYTGMKRAIQSNIDRSSGILKQDNQALEELKQCHTSNYNLVQYLENVNYNYRDHRKILLIDGKVAFTGGVNLADEYINKIERFGYWKDTALMLEGPAVDTFIVLFLQMWTYSHELLDVTPYMVEHECFDTLGFVVPYGDIPLDKDKVGKNVYIDILNHARDFVHIMTPYLILDGELLHALKFAAERGVDVIIIMPGIPDKKSAYYLAKTYYPTLLASGVKIYEYTPGFIHAKVFVSDNSRAVVGTINLDYRSLYHHFECATYLYGTSSVLDIEEDFQATKDQCHRVSTTDVKNLPFYQKTLGLLARLVAPLM